MSYFMDCFNALIALSTANLNANISAACTANGFVWTDVDFSPNNGHFLAEEYDTSDVQLGTDAELPCLAIYLDAAKNLAGSSQGMMGQTFSGPVQFCIDMHLGSESNDQMVLMAMRASVAEGVFKTFDAFSGVQPTWISNNVSYIRGLDMKVHPSSFLSAQQFQDYQGINIWLMRLSFAARFNLIRI